MPDWVMLAALIFFLVSMTAVALYVRRLAK